MKRRVMETWPATSLKTKNKNLGDEMKLQLNNKGLLRIFAIETDDVRYYVQVDRTTSESFEVGTFAYRKDTKATSISVHCTFTTEAEARNYANEVWVQLRNLFKAANMEAKKAAEPAKDAVTEPGMYKNEAGEIYKVQWNKNNTHLYALKFQIAYTPTGKPKGEFIFEKGSIFKLAASMKMSLEDVKAENMKLKDQLNVIVCCVCGRRLTAKTSKDAGIGPVCAGKI